MGRRAVHGGWCGVLRRRRWRVQRGRGGAGKAALEFTGQSIMEGIADDVPGGWKAVCGDRGRLEYCGVWVVACPAKSLQDPEQIAVIVRPQAQFIPRQQFGSALAN